MDRSLYDAYLRMLKKELIPAMGCTEPIAIAYASAAAARELGAEPEHLDVACSGNIIKNVDGVVVPNSGGQRGVKVAAILGALGGDASRRLEVLESVRPSHCDRARELLQTDFCTCRLERNVPNLYIRVTASGHGHTAEIEIRDRHTNITRITRDGRDVARREPAGEAQAALPADEKSRLNVRDILDFADHVAIDDVREVLDKQITLNTAIAEEGMQHSYGAEVGRTLLQSFGDSVKVRASAMAAAGSDARMGGCSLPVVINSGSGNQGMTVSLPVIEFARELKVPKERLYRALVVSNLVAVHQKKYIGDLSAFCGAVIAASGSGAAITYLYGGDYDAVSQTIINTIANVGGIVCDGAKSSCAAKIASAVNAAIIGSCMSAHHKSFQPGEGLVRGDVEDTIRNIGRMGRVGMESTDTEILHIMLEKPESGPAGKTPA